MTPLDLQDKNRIFLLETSIRSDSRALVCLDDLKRMVFYHNLPNTIRKRMHSLDSFFSSIGINIKFRFQVENKLPRGIFPKVNYYSLFGTTKGEEEHFYQVLGDRHLTKFTVEIGNSKSYVQSATYKSIEKAMSHAMNTWQNKNNV